jgi:hypothetical protein
MTKKLHKKVAKKRKGGILPGDNLSNYPQFPWRQQNNEQKGGTDSSISSSNNLKTLLGLGLKKQKGGGFYDPNWEMERQQNNDRSDYWKKVFGLGLKKQKGGIVGDFVGRDYPAQYIDKWIDRSYGSGIKHPKKGGFLINSLGALSFGGGLKIGGSTTLDPRPVDDMVTEMLNEDGDEKLDVSNWYNNRSVEQKHQDDEDDHYFKKHDNSFDALRRSVRRKREAKKQIEQTRKQKDEIERRNERRRQKKQDLYFRDLHAYVESRRQSGRGAKKQKGGMSGLNQLIVDYYRNYFKKGWQKHQSQKGGIISPREWDPTTNTFQPRALTEWEKKYIAY